MLQKVDNVPQKCKRNMNTKEITWTETMELTVKVYSLQFNCECNPKNARNP